MRVIVELSSFLCSELQMPAARMGGPQPNQIPRKHLEHVPRTASGNTAEWGGVMGCLHSYIYTFFFFQKCKEKISILQLSFNKQLIAEQHQFSTSVR